MSWVKEIGIIPERLIKPTVGLIPTIPLALDGHTIEPLVSVPMAKTVRLADTATPDWGFEKQYTLPSDCLRVLTIQNYESNYKIEGRKILTNDTSVKLVYVARITDPNEMDVLLRESISAALASDIAYAVTANATLQQRMAEKYQSKLSEARHADAGEGYNTDATLGPTDNISSEDFINSRL